MLTPLSEADLITYVPVLRTLSRAYHFDKAALLANRDGRLTNAQTWRVRAQSIGDVIGAVILATLALVFVAFGLQRPVTAGTLAFTLFAATLCGGLAWACKDSYRRKTADIRDGQVGAADVRVGLFQLRSSRTGVTQYGLTFDGVDQIVSQATYH